MNELNKRQRLLGKLILSSSHTTAIELAKQVGVSTKTVYLDIRQLKSILDEYHVAVEVTPRVGIKVSGQSHDIQELVQYFEQDQQQVPNSDDSRERYILSWLLREDGYISIDQLSETLYISRRVIERNLSEIARKLAGTGIKLLKVPGRGIGIEGEEGNKRRVLFKMLNQYWGNNWSVDYLNEDWLSDSEIIDNPNINRQDLKELTRIMRDFSKDLKFSLSDYGSQSLIVHLAIAINRIRTGNPISKNDDLIRNIGDNCRAEAMRLAEMVEKSRDVSLPKEEIAYIQVHLIAASTDYESLVNHNLKLPTTSKLKQILEPFGYDQDLLTGLGIHMQTAIKRLKVKIGLPNPYTEDIKRNYPHAFDEALSVAEAYEQRYLIKMNDDEVAYIALHIEAYFERKRMVHQKVKVVIVCSTGLGSAQLLAAKVRREFPDLMIKGIWSLQDFKNRELTDIDLVISTLHLVVAGIPIITVPPVMSQTDIQMIRTTVCRIVSQEADQHADFFGLIHKKLMWVHSDTTDWQAVIKMLGQKLIDNGFATDGIIESALEREQLSFTSFDNYAIPHAQPEFIKAPAIAICTLARPIVWGSHKVSVIFFLAMTKTMNQQQIDNIFDDLYSTVADNNLLNYMVRSTTPSEIIDVLKRGVEQ